DRSAARSRFPFAPSPKRRLPRRSAESGDAFRSPLNRLRSLPAEPLSEARWPSNRGVPFLIVCSCRLAIAQRNHCLLWTYFLNRLQPYCPQLSDAPFSILSV